MTAIGGAIRRIAGRLRGRPGLDEELTSTVLRARFRRQGVEVGLYSYGCFDLNRVPPGVTVGRYCSFAPSAQIFRRNHGIGFLGLTPYFYNAHLGVVDRDTIAARPLAIEDDVWLGHQCVILPSVDRIGRGAVIAAGAVVTRSVPAYAIVGGNPARVLRKRFDDATIAQIEATRWWQGDPDDLRRLVQAQPTLVFDPADHFSGHPAEVPSQEPQ